MNIPVLGQVSQKQLFIGVAVLLVAAAAVWWFYGRGASEGFADPDGPRFILYYASWCPHCKVVEPPFKEWAGSGTVDIGGKKVKVEAIEEQSIPPEMKDKVKGYPTFILHKGGQDIEFSGKRDVDGWTAFLKEHV